MLGLQQPGGTAAAAGLAAAAAAGQPAGLPAGLTAPGIPTDGLLDSTNPAAAAAALNPGLLQNALATQIQLQQQQQQVVAAQQQQQQQQQQLQQLQQLGAAAGPPTTSATSMTSIMAAAAAAMAQQQQQQQQQQQHLPAGPAAVLSGSLLGSAPGAPIPTANGLLQAGHPAGAGLMFIPRIP